MFKKLRRRVTVGLPETMAKRLYQAEQASGLPTSDIVRAALNDYLIKEEVSHGRR